MSNPYTQEFREKLAEEIEEEIFREQPDIVDDSPEYEALFQEKLEQWEFSENNPALSVYERNR